MSYKLELISLQCNNSQQRKDEPYLLVNNRLEWGPIEMVTGCIEPIDQFVIFEQDVCVELRESNHYKNDNIGTMHLSEFEVQSLIYSNHPDPLTHNFQCDYEITSNASYTLTYDVHGI